MFKVEPDQTLFRIIKLFHQFGIWPNDVETEKFKLGRRMLFSILNIILLTFIVVCAFLSDDRSQQIFLVEVAIDITVVTIKLAYLLWRKDEMLKFLNDPIVAHCIANFGESKEVNEKIKTISKFNQLYALSIILGLIFLLLVPLPIFTSDKVLPLFIQFKLECDYDFILYWLAYVFLSVGSLLNVVYNFVIILIWYIMFNYSIEYRILGNQFRRLGWKTDEKRAGKKSIAKIRNSCQQDLISLIRAHRNLFETVERFRSFFSTLFLSQITTGAISICAATYSLAYNNREGYVQIVIFSVVLLYAFFDIFLVMYLANEITVESDRLSYSLFESNWTKQSEKTKQCIIIFCEMVKQPQQLVIFIYPMNLEKFTSIVNGAYSMFNILKSFNQ